MGQWPQIFRYGGIGTAEPVEPFFVDLDKLPDFKGLRDYRSVLETQRQFGCNPEVIVGSGKESRRGLLILRLCGQCPTDCRVSVQQVQCNFLRLPQPHRNIFFPVRICPVTRRPNIIRVLFQPGDEIVSFGIRMHYTRAHARRRLACHRSRRDGLAIRA